MPPFVLFLIGLFKLKFKQTGSLMKDIRAAYENLKDNVNLENIDLDFVLECLHNLNSSCEKRINDFSRAELISNVQDKSYFAFEKNGKISRAVNIALYEKGKNFTDPFFNALKSNNFNEWERDQITAACYVTAINYCVCVDIIKSGDKKSPGTFFEYFVGHIYSRLLGVKPQKSINVLNLDTEASLPTDLIFDMGRWKAKFHVPVKTSTRERVIQVWAHQRVLDGVFGAGRFLGTLVCIAENKTGTANRKVDEICLPNQWRLYQMYIAQMKRIYYLDRPKAYEILNTYYPKIPVRDFGDFFFEYEALQE